MQECDTIPQLLIILIWTLSRFIRSKGTRQSFQDHCCLSHKELMNSQRNTSVRSARLFAGHGFKEVRSYSSDYNQNVNIKWEFYLIPQTPPCLLQLSFGGKLPAFFFLAFLALTSTYNCSTVSTIRKGIIQQQSYPLLLSVVFCSLTWPVLLKSAVDHT